MGVRQQFVDAGQIHYRDRMLEFFPVDTPVVSNGNFVSAPKGWEGKVVQIMMPFRDGRTTDIVRVKWDRWPTTMDMKPGDLHPFHPLKAGTQPVQNGGGVNATRTRSRLMSWLPSFGFGSSDN